MPVASLFPVDTKGSVRTNSKPVSTSEGILDSFTNYYSALTQDKGADPQVMQQLLDLLSKQKLAKDEAEKIDKLISTDEVKLAIKRLAPNKSPGPDGIPPEFYKQFADTLAPDLASLYNECLSNGTLTENMKR